MEALGLTSRRAAEARLGQAIGNTGYFLLVVLAVCAIAGGAALGYLGHNLGYSLVGVGLLPAMVAIWWRKQLSRTPAQAGKLADRLSHDCLVLLKPGTTYSPRSLWDAIRRNYQTLFITDHLLLPADEIVHLLSEDTAQLDGVLKTATAIADSYKSTSVEVGHLAAALLSTSSNVVELLKKLKLQPSDIDAISAWLNRIIALTERHPESFGGIGRDWASGFTPVLSRFGHNVSNTIERHGMSFGALVEGQGVTAMKTALSNGASALVLVGPDGVGKTSHAYALAQNVLAEAQDRALEHKQIIALDATAITSAAHGPGELEYLLRSLLNEAYQAGNIILFFDDARLFFQAGPGSIDATQILLPAVQSRNLQLIFALTPHDYERLRATNMAFASLLTPVILQEPPEAKVLEVLTTAASNLEQRTHVLISYEALRAVYMLSGRYETDTAYPGKAIQLLEQSLPHAQHGAIIAESVAAAIEQTRGVKAGAAAPAEAEQLLHLEDEIHKRMINQTHAVEVVASALRRARAGVASPNRPIGSFLFLGPTGVGKTELAKAIAATYFGNEAGMIRLDMSEYQQSSDVARILSDGRDEAKSLLMQVRQQPFSVVLLDEIEKAHPNILNLLLQLLDEGKLTDSQGRTVSFKDAVVIATSNAGADTIRKRIEQGEELAAFETAFTDELINSGQFKPELLNRFDEIVLFRPLKPDELAQVVRLMLGGINQTLASQNITVELTNAAVAKIVEAGNDPRLGARPMRRTLQRAVENTVAGKILRGEAHPGDHLTLDVADLAL